MLQEHLLIAAVVCRGLSALTAPGVVGTIQAPRVCQGSFGMNKGAHSVYASGLSLPRVAAVARRGDGVVVWGSPGSHGWTPQQSPNNSERSSNALLVNIRRNERNRTHANEQKRLGGTKSRATESCGVYPTRATAGETATVAADADRFAEASVSTRVLNEGVSSGATADDRCINNNTTRNGYSLRSSNRCLSSAYTNSGGTSRSTSNNSCGIMGPLNVVSTAEEGDILRGLKVGTLTWTGEGVLRLLLQRWGLHVTAKFPRLLPREIVTARIEKLQPRRGKCRLAFLGTEMMAPGQRASPCPHFLEGCGGCQFIHLDLMHQRTSKQQLLQQMLQQVLLRQQKLHNQQTPQQDIGRWEPPKVAPLVPAASETQFAARADMLLQLVEGIPRLGLPAYDGCSNIVGVQDCIRLKGPLRELYRHLTDVLLPLLKSRQLRILDQRCGAGTLSGLSLRLAEDCTGCNGMVLLRLKGHLESNVRPRLVQLAETLSKRCPALKAVTFHDLRRPYSPDEVLLGSDALLVSVFGRRFRITGGTRESVVGRGNALQQIWPAVEKAAGRAAGRLWGALGSAGLFEILLSALFKEVVVFASSAPDAEETRKNMALNDLYWGEVVECPDSGGVTAAFAARSGFSGPRRAQHRSQKGNALGKSTKSPRRVERAFEVEASDDSVEAASGVTLAGPPHLPDVLLLSPSRGGLPKDMRRWVAAAAIPRVVYIAHDQPAFFRDAEALVAAGYELADIQAFDISPHTTDVLSVSSFCRRHLKLT